VWARAKVERREQRAFFFSSSRAFLSAHLAYGARVLHNAQKHVQKDGPRAAHEARADREHVEKIGEHFEPQQRLGAGVGSQLRRDGLRRRARRRSVRLELRAETK
jgi:hypothetical protein